MDFRDVDVATEMRLFSGNDVGVVFQHVLLIHSRYKNPAIVQGKAIQQDVYKRDNDYEGYFTFYGQLC